MSNHVLNGTCNPSLSAPPLSLTIEVTILVVNVPIVQRVHEKINGNVFIFFFYTFKVSNQSQAAGVSHHTQW
jgi:hypothetical protein